MHVFITGGTGLVGSAVVAELLDHDHTVPPSPAPTRPRKPSRPPARKPLRGALADLDTLRAGAARPTASSTWPSATTSAAPTPSRRSVAEETAALTALGEALVGSDRPLVTVSGTPWVAGPRLHRVRPAADRRPGRRPRPRRQRRSWTSHRAACAASAVRLPRTVHNQGTGGFAGLLTDIARRTGSSGYPGDGTQRWPAVHALDAASRCSGSPWSRRRRNRLARRRRRGRPGTRHRRGHRPTAGPAGRVGASGDLRPARPDLRDRPALVERPHPSGPRLGADAPVTPGRPGEHRAVTRTTRCEREGESVALRRCRCFVRPTRAEDNQTAVHTGYRRHAHDHVARAGALALDRVAAASRANEKSSVEGAARLLGRVGRVR